MPKKEWSSVKTPYKPSRKNKKKHGEKQKKSTNRKPKQWIAQLIEGITSYKENKKENYSYNAKTRIFPVHAAP